MEGDHGNPLDRRRSKSGSTTAVSGVPAAANSARLSLTGELDARADALRAQVNRELGRSTDGSRALQEVVTLLCERLISIERALALSQRSSATAPGPALKRSITPEELAGMTITEDGTETQVVWDFPGSAPIEVVNLYNRMSRLEERTGKQVAVLDNRLLLLQKQNEIQANQIQLLAHNMGGTETLDEKGRNEAAAARHMMGKLQSQLPKDCEEDKHSTQPSSSLPQKVTSEGVDGEKGDGRPLVPTRRGLDKATHAAGLRSVMPKARRQLARRRWREACADIRTLVRLSKSATRPALKRKLANDETVLARLCHLEVQVQDALLKAVTEKDVHDIIKAEGCISKLAVAEELEQRDERLQYKMQDLCRALTSALVQHQSKEAQDMMTVNFGPVKVVTAAGKGLAEEEKQGSGQQRGEGDDEGATPSSFQLQDALRSVVRALDGAMQQASSSSSEEEEEEGQEEVLAQLSDLKDKVSDFETHVFIDLSKEHGSFRSLETAGRAIETAILDATRDGTRALSYLSSTLFTLGAPHDAALPPTTLADGLCFLLHHIALVLQAGKLQQVELLALSNSQARAWADQNEVTRLNESLLTMRSQMVTDLDQLYNAVNRLEAALAESKAFQELLKSELQSTMADRQSLEDAVSKLSGRSELLRSFLDGKIAEVERMVESKAGASEVFNVKSSINDVMTHLLKVREGLPPEGFWSEVAEQLKSKADKKVLYKLLKERETKQFTEDGEGNMPAVGRLKLRCLSCDKALPPDPQERPYMGSPRHEYMIPPYPPIQYNDYEEHRYTYQQETVDIVARRERPKSSSVYDRSSSRGAQYPRMMGGPLGAAHPIWRIEGDHPTQQSDKNKGLKRQLFHQRLREIVDADSSSPPPPEATDASSPDASPMAHFDQADLPTPADATEGCSSPYPAYIQRSTKVLARGMSSSSTSGGNNNQQQQGGRAEYVTSENQQAHAIQWVMSDQQQRMARPRSAPGQPRQGTLPFDHAALHQGKAWRRSFSKIHIPQRGFALKNAYYQRGPF